MTQSLLRLTCMTKMGAASWMQRKWLKCSLTSTAQALTPTSTLKGIFFAGFMSLLMYLLVFGIRYWRRSTLLMIAGLLLTSPPLIPRFSSPPSWCKTDYSPASWDTLSGGAWLSAEIKGNRWQWKPFAECCATAAQDTNRNMTLKSLVCRTQHLLHTDVA